MTHAALARRPLRRRSRSYGTLLLRLATGVLFAAACSESAGSAIDEAPATTTTTEEAAVAGLDFVAGSEVDLGDGWTVAPCESGPPLFCAHHDGATGTQAVIELLSVPTASYPAVKAALDDGRSPAEALSAQAAEYHATFASDRPAGCGAGYDVQPIGPDEVTVAGQPGILYGFDGHHDGRHVERNLHFATVRGETLHIVATTAVDDGTCMDDGTLAEFTVAELIELQPGVTQMIAASTLP